jgi:hypothetical protein
MTKHLQWEICSNTQISAVQSDSARYTLIVRQQPQSARACGFGERDRRVIDPPPILVLEVDNPVGSETYAVHCVLWNPALDEDDSTMPVSTERKQQSTWLPFKTFPSESQREIDY